ncbi:hypothetical protein BUALT_Bualt08G0037500 [Buddleja alternifolia]|uniref:Uncharacterized protein n=1 Tax=Buddleja alternifolia TaxID=168488 RepID=A0AAV6XAQ1_9LAMI|nr:hypothetical protein BUALT_Bualt08G0037500 [Buddleja alternifolia]
MAELHSMIITLANQSLVIVLREQEVFRMQIDLAGLKSEIAIQVRMFKPKNLQDVTSLASKKRQLYLMEAVEEEEELGREEQEVEHYPTELEVEDSNNTNCHVSVHAMSGVYDYRTMRVIGHVEILSQLDQPSTGDGVQISSDASILHLSSLEKSTTMIQYPEPLSLSLMNMGFVQ